jgi:hypothetical protein
VTANGSSPANGSAAPVAQAGRAGQARRAVEPSEQTLTAQGISLTRGDASAEELAALIAVLSAASATEEAAPPRPRSTWTSRERLMRRPLSPGPGAWRASALPG